MILSLARRNILLAVLLGVGQAAPAQTPEVSPDDQSEIQALSAQYAQALGACRAEEFADLFAPATGYFASGFRGHFEGREQLIALVQSERHCTAGAQPAARGGASEVPAAILSMSSGRVHGIVQLGTASYQDEYTQTPAGWRFASRTVVINSETEAGLDARDMLAINLLGGGELGEYYEADQSGAMRLLTVGTRITVVDGEVTGRVFLTEGGYRDEVYAQTGPGQWRVTSSTYVAP